MVQLTQELVERLDDEARAVGLSRSAVIRQAVSEHLERSQRSAIARRIVDGYRRVPPAVPDQWGDAAGDADVAVRELSQRLDAEERVAGLDPW